MKSNYALYLEERSNRSIIEDDKGFATYYYPEKGIVYIEDVFVKKEHRRSKVAYGYADYIVKKAKNIGCTLMLGSVDPEAIGANASRKFIKNYGLKYTKNRDGLEWYCKEI